MIHLALLRHGHTEWNRAARIQGRTDIPMDAEAVAVLSGLELPPQWQAADLWSSPLSRAHETARLVSGQTPQTDAALMEMNWGDWEGLRGADLRDDPTCDYRPIEDWGWDYTPPQGEPPSQLRARLKPWIAARSKDSLAVCHIGVMRVVLAMATGWNFDGPAPFQIKRNRLYVIEVDGDDLRLWPEPVRLPERNR